MKIHLLSLLFLLTGVALAEDTVTLNQKDDGYRGIWYSCGEVDSIYKYKYSGGLGTYCAKHRPFAVHCEEADKTFFCYGGTTKHSHRELLHMVSYYDHQTGMVPRPTVLLNKHTSDAHDNPVMNVDDEGYIWIFSTAHGTGRPSYIHRSKKPYDIDAFELIPATKLQDGKRVPMTNFSYFQSWHIPDRGFVCFFTRYRWGSERTICFMTSRDGIEWSEWQRIAMIDRGHYQVSWANTRKMASAFNYHPRPIGLNARSNLYYVESTDMGTTWQTAAGKPLVLPLKEADSPALVHDYRAEGLLVYLNDIKFDADNNPVLLYVTSHGHEPGEKNGPRTWRTARWTGDEWDIRAVTTSDNNYDMGPLYIDDIGHWRIIGPTDTGPQPYNTGGEMVLWASEDQGHTWKRVRQVTENSKYNHTYARAPLNAHDDFWALWADGHGREESESRLYFCDRQGQAFVLPRKMTGAFAQPEPVSATPPSAKASAD